MPDPRPVAVLAPVVLLGSLAVVATAAGAAGATTAAAPSGPVAAPGGAGAVPAPLCSVPRGAGVLALVPPPAPGGGAPVAEAAVGANRTAVVDHVEGDRAVLLAEARGDVVARRAVRREALPRAARHAGAVVTVSVVADSVARITYRPAETARGVRADRRRLEHRSRCSR